MKAAVILTLTLTLGACGALRNGGGLMGNHQAGGGTIVLIENGQRTEIEVRR